MSDNPGKQFEKDYEDSYKGTKYSCIRLKDSAKWTRTAAFTPKNECDMIVHMLPYMYLLELKSTKGAGISFNPYKEGISYPWEKPTHTTTAVMIKGSQVKSLMKYTSKDGAIPGFILNYRERELKTKKVDRATFFLHVSDFINFAKATGKSTISIENCIEWGGVPIEETLKKVHYTYNIEKFKKDTIDYCNSKNYIV